MVPLKFPLTLLLYSLLPVIVFAQEFPDPGCPRDPTPPPYFIYRAVCDRRGQLDAAPLAAQKANNFQQCRNLCLRRPKDPTEDEEEYPPDVGCARFLWHSDSKICEFYSIDAQFKANSSSLATFFDSRCFNCTGCIPQVGANLLDNGGFEINNQLYGPWETVTKGKASIVHPGYNSRNALYVAAMPDNDTGTTLFITQDIASCKDLLHAASLWFKPVFNQGGTPVISVSAGDTRVYVPARSVRNNTWTQFRFYFISRPQSRGRDQPARLPMRLSVTADNRSSNSAGSPLALYVDEAKIAVTEKSLTVPASSPELVQNGGFESGQLAPWSVSNYGPDDTVGVKQPGIRSQYAFVARTPHSPSSNFQIAQRVHGLVIGAEYLLSLDFIGVFNTFFTISIGSAVIRAGKCYDGSCRGNIQSVFIARETSPNLSVYVFYGYVDIPVSLQVKVDNISLKKL